MGQGANPATALPGVPGATALGTGLAGSMGVNAGMGATTQRTVGAPPPPPGAEDGSGASGGTGFLNLSRLLGVNADQGARMAGQMSAKVEKEGKDVQGALANGQPGNKGEGDDYASYAKEAQDASEGAAALGTASGRLAAEKKNANAGNYDQSKGAFDSLLTGSGAAAGKLDTVSNAYQGLAQQLGVAQQNQRTNQAAQAAQRAAQTASQQQADAERAQRDGAQKAQGDANNQAATAYESTQAGEDDPDKGWGAADPIWKSITREDAFTIQNARTTMSPSGYRSWLLDFKKQLKQRGH